jgi:HEAT repeat protein
MGGLAAPAVARLLASAGQFELEDIERFYDNDFDNPKAGLFWTLANTLMLVGSHDVEAVRRALNSEKATVRIAGIAAFDERCLDAWDELMQRFDDPEPFVRRMAVQCMARLGKDAAPALPRLQHMLTDEDPTIRKLATGVIGFLGDAGARAAPDVAQRLLDDEEPVRSAAAASLLRLGAPGLDALRTLLRSDREAERLRAVEAVVGFGQQHYLLSKQQERDEGAFLRDIARTLDDAHAPVRATAVRAVHVMLEGLRFADAVKRTQSQGRIFELIGDRVVELAADEDTHTRAEAIRLLAVCWEKLSEQEGQVRRALSAIAAGCRDEKPEVRRVALLALAKMRKLPAGVPERLLAGLDDEHPDVRAAAAQAVWGLFYGCDPETNAQLSGSIYMYPPPKQVKVDIQETVRKLTARLSDKHGHVRLSAAKALIVFVGDARTALPALRKLEQDPDPEVRKAAAETIEWVEKDGHYCGAVYARLPSAGGYELPKPERR